MMHVVLWLIACGWDVCKYGECNCDSVLSFFVNIAHSFPFLLHVPDKKIDNYRSFRERTLHFVLNSLISVENVLFVILAVTIPIPHVKHMSVLRPIVLSLVIIGVVLGTIFLTVYITSTSNRQKNQTNQTKKNQTNQTKMKTCNTTYYTKGMISGKNNFACRNSYVDMRINNAVLQLILQYQYHANKCNSSNIHELKNLLNSDWLRVRQFYWETVSCGNWFKFWQLKTCMKSLCHSNDHNLFLHNLFIYIMNHNSMVSRGIWGNIFVLCRDLYNFGRLWQVLLSN